MSVICGWQTFLFEIDALFRMLEQKQDGGRRVRTFGRKQTFGFASDALYCFDCRDGALRATVVRASGYALHVTGAVPSWRPPVDCGELKFRFLINSGNDELPLLAQTLEQPPIAVLVPAKAGTLPRTGSLAALSPVSLQVLALKKAEDGKGLVLRGQETAGRSTAVQLRWLGRRSRWAQSAPTPSRAGGSSAGAAAGRPHALQSWRSCDNRGRPA